MYTEKSFHGHPRLEYHALSQQNKLFFFIEKKALFVLFLWIIVCMLVITFLFIPNKAVIMSRTLGGPVVLRK